MRGLLGFQITDATGTNIQGDDNDPIGLASFEVMSPLSAIAVMAGLPADHSYLLQPIYQGDIEEPVIVNATVIR